MLVPKKDTLFSSWQTHPHHTSLVSSATKPGAAAKGQISLKNVRISMLFLILHAGF